MRSAEPVTNQSFVGSTATARTQPRWPEMTRLSFHGACHLGLGTSVARRRMSALLPNCAAVSLCFLYSTTAEEPFAAVVSLSAHPPADVSTAAHSPQKCTTNVRALLGGGRRHLLRDLLHEGALRVRHRCFLVHHSDVTRLHHSVALQRRPRHRLRSHKRLGEVQIRRVELRMDARLLAAPPHKHTRQRPVGFEASIGHLRFSPV